MKYCGRFCKLSVNSIADIPRGNKANMTERSEVIWSEKNRKKYMGEIIGRERK